MATAEAQRLLETWLRLERSHIPLGGGCSCGAAAGGGLSLREVERDILDYLSARHARVAAIMPPRDAAGRSSGESGPLAALLTALAAAPPSDRESDRRLLADLARSIESIAHLHHRLDAS